MKKNLFLISVVALALGACSNDTTLEQAAQTSNQPAEIAISALSQKATRGTGAILDNFFLTTSDIEVAAYNAGVGEFFANTTFGYNYAAGAGSGTNNKWGCKSGAIYWPFTACTINFLAYANLTSGSASWGTSSSDDASKVVLTMADNKTEQNDLMYAVGQGSVVQTGNALTIPDDVDMVFKHAQSLITFKAKASVGPAVTINKITLNDAYFEGKLTVDNSANYNVTTAPADPTATWSNLGSATDKDVYSGTLALTTSLQDAGQVMVVPNPSGDSFASFTINYTLNGNTYDYVFTPTDRNLSKATNYEYDITFTLHEIFIDASVTTWTDATTNYVDVPTKIFNYVASTGETGTYTLPSATAGTYTVTIAGLPSSTYTVSEGAAASADQDFITGITTSNLSSVTSINVSFTVEAASGKNHNILIKDGETTKFTLTVSQP